jgi:hypothetical protein
MNDGSPDSIARLGNLDRYVTRRGLGLLVVCCIHARVLANWQRGYAGEMDKTMSAGNNSTLTLGRWLKANIVLVLAIVVPFFVGGYYWGQAAQDDYKQHPGIDAGEARWGTLEAYGGAAIVFGGVGALIYYVAIALTRRS